MALSLDACLPAELRGPRTTITKIAAGLSGAGVHRVEVDGRAYVLKVTAGEQPLADWRRTLAVLRAASDAGLAPRLVHVDESRRATVSEFVEDQSFSRLYRDPRTHDAALALLGETLRRVHALPVPPDSPPGRPRELLGTMWSGVPKDANVPAFVTDAVRRALAEPPPVGRPPVLGHNDANPSNFVLDGARILFLDWDAAAPNDPLWDLAVVSLFLRMDDATCRRLVAAHDAAPPEPLLPPAFRYFRWLSGVMLSVGFLSLARKGGYGGAAPDSLDAVPPLLEFYQKLQSGALSLRSSEGQWAFGLGLMKEAHALGR